MKRFLVVLALSFSLVSCGEQPAAIGDTPAPSSSVVDTALLEATRALTLAEIAYEPIATTALKLIETGQMKGVTASTVRDLNHVIRDAFKAAKAAQSAAVIYEELSKAKAASTSLGAIVKAFEEETSHEVR